MEDKSVFDMGSLLRSTCDDKELAGQVVEVFLSDIPVQLADLQSALDRNDAVTAERVAHSIKGASATVGGALLRDVAFECEQCGKSSDLAGLRDRMTKLREQYDILQQVLRGSGLIQE